MSSSLASLNTFIVASVAALGILVAVLGAWVTTVRVRTSVMYHGERMDPASPMAKAVRAHGNAAEYAGMLMALYLVTGLVYGDSPMDTWVVTVIVGLTVARYMGAIGFLTSQTLEKIHPFKALAAISTYGGTLALAINVLLKL
jgi:uncharacterized protein